MSIPSFTYKMIRYIGEKSSVNRLGCKLLNTSLFAVFTYDKNSVNPYFCAMARKNRKAVFENVEVLDAGAKGKSIAKAPDGKIILINNAVPGDIATVQTYKKRKAYYEGKAISFQQLSEKRVDPVCQHFGVCGGCKWQHMAYEQQLFYKQQEVENNLKRIGKIKLPAIDPILGARKIYFYRNKMEFSFSSNRWLSPEEIESAPQGLDRHALGFHAPGMWDKIIDIQKCHLQEDPSNAIRNYIRDFAKQNDIPFYNPRAQEGLLRSLMIRTASTGELMVLLQFFYQDDKNQSLLLDTIRTTFPEITSLLYVINTKGNDTLYDQEILLHSGKMYIEEEMEGFRFRIQAKSFYQTNSAQAYELYKVTRDFAGLTGDEIVYDLYTGTGTIAQFISRNARKVIGIEAVPDAIRDAKENANVNGIDNCTFHVGDMKTILTPEFIRENGQPDVVITDPPRDGMHRDVIEQIKNALPGRIVYVSCNSATQARDLQLLDQYYQVQKVRPVDMFPQTYHVENVVLLERREA